MTTTLKCPECGGTRVCFRASLILHSDAGVITAPAESVNETMRGGTEGDYAWCRDCEREGDVSDFGDPWTDEPEPSPPRPG